MFGRALVRLSAAACFVVAGSSAWAQEAAQTAGGDVTADEATPLPPVVVSAPRERRVTRYKPLPTSTQTSAPASTATTETAATAGQGSEATALAPGQSVGVFTLGQLDLIGGSTITNEAMWVYNKPSLDQAVSILPGVSSHNAGGSRNERDIFVRGFDRIRVPLYLDGVRINLPYDNRLDFSRFLTPDLSEIQVQKGYVSVLNGPGGMGGAINLVSRKPTKPIELEGRVGAVFDGDLASMGQWSAYAFSGTRQKGYYAQISGNIVDQDHFDMSSDFTPTDPSTPGYRSFFSYEDGGNRDRSSFEDWRINAKAGITPNATDEYSINYTNQQSEKEAPLHTGRQIVQGYQFGSENIRRFWDWPQWDISTLSWLSKTKLGDASYIKTNAYYNTFDNIVSFYREKTYTLKRADSPYADHSSGGFVELGTDLIPMNTLKGAIHFRRDVHTADTTNYDVNGDFASTDPTVVDSEKTWSFALENTFHATRQLDFVAGLSYDKNEVIRADGTAEPLPELGEWNWQSAVVFRYSGSGEIHADVSSRTRFPTLFDRYSTRFGGRSEEPGLGAERATNYEIGISETLGRTLHLSSAVFYSDIQDSIQSTFSAPNSMGAIVVYNADGEHHGFELSADWDATRTLRFGGNYTYLERDIDFQSASRNLEPPFTPLQSAAVAAAQVEGTPRHEFFLYASWKPVNQLTLTPSMEIASERTVLVTSCASTLISAGGPENANGACSKPAGTVARPPNYTDIGAYATLNFQAEYAFNENATMAIGAKNILDENYALAEGFPEPGRQFYATARAKF